jgi:hypothetical protein
MPNQPAAIKFYIREIRVFKLGTVLEYFIDDVLLGRKPPVPNIEGRHVVLVASLAYSGRNNAICKRSKLQFSGLQFLFQTFS